MANQSTTTETSSQAKELQQQGWSFFTKGEHEAAEEYFRNAARLDPMSVDAKFSLGLVLKAQDRRKETIETFEQVISLLSAENVQDVTRRSLLRRLALGHINQVRDGDWNLEKEIWHRAA